MHGHVPICVPSPPDELDWSTWRCRWFFLFDRPHSRKPGSQGETVGRLGGAPQVSLDIRPALHYFNSGNILIEWCAIADAFWPPRLCRLRCTVWLDLALALKFSRSATMFALQPYFSEPFLLNALTKNTTQVQGGRRRFEPECHQHSTASNGAQNAPNQIFVSCFGLVFQSSFNFRSRQGLHAQHSRWFVFFGPTFPALCY